MVVINGGLLIFKKIEVLVEVGLFSLIILVDAAV